MKISVAFALPDAQIVKELEVSAGCTLGEAVALASLKDVQVDQLVPGVWGKVKSLDYVLREGDRVELYRPLVADPKTARRRRAAR
jgi:uncharacterized protein